MNISNELWRKFKTMRQEILDLKQVKKASCASKYFEYNINTSTFYTTWKITYKSGNQPIIAEVLSYADSSLSVPVNNIQYLFTFSQAITDITILSTREIESVEGIE